MSSEEKRDLLVNAIHQAHSGNIVTVTPQSHVLNTGGSDSVVVQTRRSTVKPKSKHLRVLDEFEDEDSDADVMAMVTRYLSVNEKQSDELRADPLLYCRTSRFVGLASLANNYLD